MFFASAFKKKKQKEQDTKDSKNKQNKEEERRTDQDNEDGCVKREQRERKRSVLRIDSYDRVYDLARWKPQDLVSLSDDFKLQLKSALGNDSQATLKPNAALENAHSDVHEKKPARRFSVGNLLEVEHRTTDVVRRNSSPEEEIETVRDTGGSEVTRESETKIPPTMEKANYPHNLRHTIGRAETTRAATSTTLLPEKKKPRRRSAPAMGFSDVHLNRGQSGRTVVSDSDSLRCPDNTSRIVPRSPSACSTCMQTACVNMPFRVIESYKRELGDDNILDLQQGDLVNVVEKNKHGWWLVEFQNKRGWFPSTYLFPIPRPRRQEPSGRRHSLPRRSFFVMEDYHNMSRGEAVEVLAVNPNGYALIRSPEKVIVVPPEIAGLVKS